jgi:amidase/aspartyl-tRNA(Asn)/glutamyl-tRNA(Gln) amidotransferase subunit A
LGAVVEEVDLPMPPDAVDRAAAIHFHLGFGAWVAEAAEEHGDLMTPYALEFARWSARTANGGSLLEKHEIEARLYLPLGALLERFDALICPTVGTTGLVAGDDYVGHGTVVDGRQIDFYFQTMLTPVFNVLSRCPVLNVPSGVAANGVPTGAQIVGRTFEDQTPFRIGAAAEHVRPWSQRRPALQSAAA